MGSEPPHQLRDENLICNDDKHSDGIQNSYCLISSIYIHTYVRNNTDKVHDNVNSAVAFPDG